MVTHLASLRSTASLRFASWGGLSSVLRPAASDHRAAASVRRTLWQGLARALRAAGPCSHGQPLHALMVNVDCVRGNDQEQRLRDA